MPGERFIIKKTEMGKDCRDGGGWVGVEQIKKKQYRIKLLFPLEFIYFSYFYQIGIAFKFFSAWFIASMQKQKEKQAATPEALPLHTEITFDEEENT